MNRKLTTAQIRAAARALHARGQLSGPRLREHLQRRFGARGAADRVYEIVRDVLQRPPRPYRQRPPVAPACAQPTARVPHADDSIDRESPDMLVAERDAAVARAQLLEERYEADTSRWMREVDALRTRLASEGRAPPLIYGRDPRDVVRDLEVALATAKRRIAELEARSSGEGP